MKLCGPTGISLDGDVGLLDQCVCLVVSFFFSILAVGIFVISDFCLVRRGMGSTETVAGMGMFPVMTNDSLRTGLGHRKSPLGRRLYFGSRKTLSRIRYRDG
jgi:hypothetical protein